MLIMKIVLFIVVIFFIVLFFVQEVKIDECFIDFVNGKYNVIVVIILYGKKEIVEKELKLELKLWNGKYNSLKGEMMMIGSMMKVMGDKFFDGYVKVIFDNDDEVQVVVVVDFGGVYFESKIYGFQYKVIKGRLEKFGVEVVNKSFDDQIEIE